jgi:hypothetical protein
MEKSQNYATRQTAPKFWCVLILLLSFLFKRKQSPSKLTAFCNQLTKPTTSYFYAEFRNSLPVMSCYSVEPLRPPASTSVLLQYHIVIALWPVTHLSCHVKMWAVTSLLSYLSVQQHNCKLNFFFHFPIQILWLRLYCYVLQKVISEIQ